MTGQTGELVSSATIEPSSSGTKKTKVLRGKTVCRALTLLPNGTKLKLEFDTKHRAVGKYRPLFASFQGVLVRNMEITPINKPSWHEIDEKVKDAIVESILQKFEFGDVPERIVVLKKELGKKFRDYRYKLKKNFYNPYVTDEECLENKPNFVNDDEWTWLVTKYWNIEKVKEMCEKNSDSRESQEMLHRAGRRSHADIEHEEFQRTGQRPSRLRIFELAYKASNDNSMDGFTATKQEEISNHLRERDEGLNNLSDEDIFDKVFGKGKYGRVVCRGFGVTQTSEFGSSGKCAEEVAAARKEAADARKEAEEANKNYDAMNLRLEETTDAMSGMQAQIERLYSMLETRTCGEPVIERDTNIVA